MFGRVVVAVFVLEAILCGAILGRRAWRETPPVPAVVLDDPFVTEALQRYAAGVDAGKAGAWRTLGEALVGKGFYAHAEHAFRRALLQEPEDFRSRFGLAFSLDRMGRIEESLQQYQAVASNSSGDMLPIQAWYAIGVNHLRTSAGEQAMQAFKKLVGFAPADYQRAKLLLRANQPEECLKIVTSHDHGRGLSLEFLSLKYRALQTLGRNRDAMEAAVALEHAMTMGPLSFNMAYVMPLAHMAGMTTLLSDYEGADDAATLVETERNRIREVIGDTPLYALKMLDEQLLRFSAKAGRTDRVLELLDEFRRQGREYPLMLEVEGDSRLTLGDDDAALRCWDRAVHLFPTPALHAKLAAYFATRDPVRRAFHASQEALLTGLAAVQNGRLDLARSMLVKATELFPENASAWFHIGELAVLDGRRHDARHAYQKCLEISPGHGRALQRLSFLDQP